MIEMGLRVLPAREFRSAEALDDDSLIAGNLFLGGERVENIEEAIRVDVGSATNGCLVHPEKLRARRHAASRKPRLSHGRLQPSRGQPQTPSKEPAGRFRVHYRVRGANGRSMNESLRSIGTSAATAISLTSVTMLSTNRLGRSSSACMICRASMTSGFAAKTTKASFRPTNGSPFDYTPRPFSPRR